VAKREAQAEKSETQEPLGRPETIAEELKRIRQAGRVDYSKFIKRKPK
jgi:hypothetical protein